MKLELIKSLFLPDFPSGSSISIHRDKLYLIGDDAKDILVLDTQYNPITTIHLFDYPDKRIPKPIKQDFETSTIVNLDGSNYLFVLGSGSLQTRTKGFLISLEAKDQAKHSQHAFEYSIFLDRVKALDIGEINTEGGAIVENHFVLSNRSNLKNPDSKLLVTDIGFWMDQEGAGIYVIDLILPIDTKPIIGVSELYYLESLDVLFFTLSTEVTSDAYDDGPIGDSYLGWIDAISNKIKSPTLSLDGMINLSDCSTEFKGEKIEGLCVETNKNNEMTLHFVSDNDKGASKLFKVKALL